MLGHKEDEATVAARQTLLKPRPPAPLVAARLGTVVVAAARRHVSVRKGNIFVTVPARRRRRLAAPSSAPRLIRLAVAAAQELPAVIAARL